VAGEYLYLAATLIFLKSKNSVTLEEQMALKKEFAAEELDILSESDLVKRLLELQHYQKVSQLLWQLPKKGHEIFVRPRINRKKIIDTILTPIDKQELINVMMDYLFREKRKYTVIKRDRLSIKEKLHFLKEFLTPGTTVYFTELLEKHGGEDDQDNVVITFISLLELARLKQIQVFQNEDRGAIYIDVVSDLQNFDVDTANGFEPEDAPPLEGIVLAPVSAEKSVKQNEIQE
jgi:segregation and condensation protein A